MNAKNLEIKGKKINITAGETGLGIQISKEALINS